MYCTVHSSIYCIEENNENTIVMSAPQKIRLKMRVTGSNHHGVKKFKEIQIHSFSAVIGEQYSQAMLS
jgi:hypothetical protein